MSQSLKRVSEPAPRTGKRYTPPRGDGFVYTHHCITKNMADAGIDSISISEQNGAELVDGSMSEAANGTIRAWTRMPVEMHQALLAGNRGRALAQARVSVDNSRGTMLANEIVNEEETGAQIAASLPQDTSDYDG